MKSWLPGLRGFTLIELMIVVAIIAILAAIAYPSYQDSVRKSRRADAIAALTDLQLQQEKWRANNTTYADFANPGATPPTVGLARPASNYYLFSITNIGATTYTLNATAQGDQLNDKDGATTCSPLTINQNNQKGPVDSSTPPKVMCWKK